MKKELKTSSTVCGSCGRWFFYTCKTRPRIYCDECSDYRRREATKLRVKAYRKRQREAQTTSNKRPDDDMSRPVADGYRSAVLRSSPEAVNKGLFSDVPEPGRTTKRKLMGLS